MKQVWALFLKNIRVFLNDKGAVVLTFIVPMVLIYIFGNVFGGRGGSGRSSGIPVAVVDESDSRVARQIVNALDAEESIKVLRNTVDENGIEQAFDESKVRELLQKNKIRYAIIIPEQEQGGENEDTRFRIKYLFNPVNDIEQQVVEGLFQKTIFTSAPGLIFQSLQQNSLETLGSEEFSQFNEQIAGSVSEFFGAEKEAVLEMMNPSTAAEKFEEIIFGQESEEGEGSAQAGGALADFDLMGEIIDLNREQVIGEKVRSPGLTRMVGGWAIMFLLFSLSGSAISLFDEKKAGIFLRILTGPISRGHILWSNTLFQIALGIVQLVILFLAGWVMFKIDIFGNFHILIIVLVFAAAACTSFGMLLASVCSSPAQANAMATFLILTMSAIGGAWFPISFMPDTIQLFSRLTIVYWAIQGIQKAVWQGAGLVDVLPELGVLLGIAVVVIGFSMWRFRKGDMFA